MTKWELDKAIEENVAKFTDLYFWGRFRNADVSRAEDLQAQYAGVDVRLSAAGGTLNFDEKAKIRGTLNEVYGYPSFELEMTSRGGVRREGWFFSALSTDYYSFIAVSADTCVEDELSADGRISAVDVLWVKKSDVQEMVRRQMTDEQLRKDVEELQEGSGPAGGDSAKARKKYGHGLFWLTYSKRLKERPVNLVTTRRTLEGLPHTRHFVVTREKVEIA